MSNSWKSIAARIDALSLRERAFLFFSALAICAALADTFWITPARSAHKQMTQQFSTESLEMGRLRDLLKAKVEQPDPARVLRQEIQRVQAEIARVDGQIAASASQPGSSPGLRELMVHFLASHSALSLVRTGNVSSDTAAGAGNTSGSGDPAAARQSLELTVAGRYPELVRYVESLEKSMPQLRWGQMRLTAEQQPAQLTLQVFLIRPAP